MFVIKEGLDPIERYHCIVLELVYRTVLAEIIYRHLQDSRGTSVGKVSFCYMFFPVIYCFLLIIQW